MRNPLSARAVRALAAYATLALFLGAGGAAATRGEIIDRVLATVQGEIITLSDVRTALKFGLVPPDVSTDPVGAALQRLIDRRLILAEVERYAPPEPSDASVDAAIADIVTRFPDPASFDAALERSTLSKEELRAFVRDTLMIQAYERQRFNLALQPSGEDVAQYYREHPGQFTLDGVLQPLESVRNAARDALLEQRRTTAIQEWLEGLRRRASIVVVYLPGRG